MRALIVILVLSSVAYATEAALVVSRESSPRSVSK